MIVSEPRRAIAEWLASRVPHFTIDSTPYTALALTSSDGRITAAVVYDNFTQGVNVDTHIAIAGKRLTPQYLGEIFRYPFLQLGCRRITGKVAASNTASRHLCERFGFALEGICRQAMPDGDDMILFGMLREQCRWLEVGKRG